MFQSDGDLFHDFDAEAFESGNFFRTIREQPDAAETEIGENLGANADFALDLFVGVVERGKCASTMKVQRGAIANFLDGESLGRLMKINQRAAAFLCDGEQCAFEGSAAVGIGSTCVVPRTWRKPWYWPK